VLGQRRIAALAAAALAVAAGGCTAATSGKVTVTGKTLTIYVSKPKLAYLASDQRAADVLSAARLAFSQAGASNGSYTLQLRTLQSSKPSDSGRSAISDSSAIAYIGEVIPGTSGDSAGITNAEDLLQVSPTDTALELTTATSAVPGAPNRYFEALKTYGKTFARVVPNTAREAKAQVLQMRSLRVRRIYVADDGSHYGKAIALALRGAAAPSLQVLGVPTGADAVFYGASTPARASAFFNQTAQSTPNAKLFASSALASSAFLGALSPRAARNLYVSQPGIDPKSYSSLARRMFAVPFRRQYGRTPSPEAIFGYEAMAAVLAVLREDGGAATDRSKVARDFFAIRNRQSVLGTYSLNANGDTSLASFVFSRLRGGKLVPVRSVQAQG
jgi:branched-chain amino acid transport system substrate-binding protein